MAIIKTHFYNISFEHKDLMKMLIKLSEYQEDIFPQDSKKVANNVKGVSAMDQYNPYNESLDDIYHILNRLNLNSNVQNDDIKEVDLEKIKSLINDINQQLDNIVEIKNGIVKEKDENDEAIILLKNIEKAKISVDDVATTKYITCRLGKLPVDEFTKIQYYRDYEFIFRELNRTNEYVWIIYAGLSTNIYEIDNAFSSMSFEPIALPQFAHGKIGDAVEELSQESAAMAKYIQEMDDNIAKIKNDHETELLDTFTKIYNLKRLYDRCKFVVDFSQKAAVYAFSSLDINAISERLKDIDSVKIMELPANIYQNRNIIAPILVKNNSFVYPFEGVLSNHLGDSFDPTTIVAIVTLVIFGIALGDIAVGAVVLVLGLLLHLIKKGKFAGILQRLGLAILVVGLVYGHALYHIQLYPALIALPIDYVTAFIFGLGIWVAILIILIIVKKLTRKSIEV